MMVKRVIVVTIALVISALLQGSVAVQMAVGPARPDLILIAVVCAGLLTNPAQGISGGLVGGVLMAVQVGTNYGTFIVTRVVAGWVSGVIGRTLHRESLITPLLAIVAATVATQLLAFVMAPSAPKRWALGSLGELVYNVVLVLPVFLTLQRMIRPPRARDPYERRLRRNQRRR